MFLVRSAFWLSAAFIVMAPSAGMDVGQAAHSTGEQLVSQGAYAVSETLLPRTCGTIECVVGRAVVHQAIGLPEAMPVGETASVISAEPMPFPPPRPAWAY